MSRTSIIFVAIIVALTGGGLFFYYSNTTPAGGIDISDANLIALGKALYAQECASCHGKNLEGQTRNWRQRLPDGSIPAPPHDASGHTWHHPDSMLFEITKYGRLKAAPPSVRSNMPAFEKKLTDQEIWAVLSYIKSRWPANVRSRHDSLNRRAAAQQ